MNRRIIFGIILLLILGFCVYLNSLWGVLFWDDEVTVINNIFIRQPFVYLKDIFLSSYHSGSGETLNFYRPLATLSFALDYHFWQLEPFGYHLSNVILHLASGILLFLLLNQIFHKPSLSFLSAAFFLVHPVNSEAVNYVSNRTDLSMLFFFMIAFCLYVSYRQRGKRYFLAGSLFAYILCILSKEMGLILPLFILAYECIIKDNPKQAAGSSQIRRFMPLAGFGAIFTAYVAARSTLLNFLKINLLTQGAQAEPFSRDLIIRLLVQAKAGIIYLKLFFWPVGLHMEYDRPVVLSRLDPGAWLALLSLLLLAGFVFYAGRKNKSIIFGASWFLLGLLPVSGTIPINNVISEHYLYLASGGFFLLVSAGILRLWSIARVRIFINAILVTVMIVLGASTVLRNLDWHKPLKMYLDIISSTKYSFRAHNNAGVEYFRKGDFARAEQYFRSSLEILPTYAHALNNLGVIYKRKGNAAEAERLYKDSIKADQDYLLAHENLLGIYFSQKRFAEARKEIKKILEIYPQHPYAQKLLGELR
ncbi:tetratricopeptide repeat protein [Candidatus Omnitrophota bacterium]